METTCTGQHAALVSHDADAYEPKIDQNLNRPFCIEQLKTNPKKYWLHLIIANLVQILFYYFLLGVVVYSEPFERRDGQK